MQWSVTARAALTIGLIALIDFTPAKADPKGIWRGSDGGQLRIAGCGAGLCGFIASLNPRNDPATGRPWTDKFNADASKRSRPLIGVQVLFGMRPSGDGKWSGRLYHSENGQTYAGNLIEVDARTIRVEGCALGMCGGENLTRVQSAPVRASSNAKPTPAAAEPSPQSAPPATATAPSAPQATPAAATPQPSAPPK